MSPFTIGILLLNALFILVLASAAGYESRACKSVPGSTYWPSQRSWSRFNESLDGRLLKLAPPGAVCHPEQRTYDVDRCAVVVDSWSTYKFHAEHPTSLMANQFSNDSCLPDPDYPCDDGGYPPFVVNATAPKHIQLAVDFAKKNNLRLVVKGTGHDFLGRSIAPNALSIWTRHMKGIEYHKASFKPRGCQNSVEGNAVTAKAGSQMMELYEFTDQYGEVIIGGGGATVGIGGYLTGGGHSILSPRYGLASDQVLEIAMVAPNGEFVTANECQNEDFFWAMRGGGGSTFGVITSITLKTYSSPKIVHLNMGLFGSPTDPGLADWVAYFVSKFPYFESKGISGYTAVGRGIPNALKPDGDPVSGVIALLAMQDTDDESDILSVINPVVEEVKVKFPDAGIVFAPAVSKYESFLAWFQVFLDKNQPGVDVCHGGRLLSEKHLTADVGGLANAITTAMDAVGVIGFFIVSGKGVREAEPRGGGSAVLPAWRKAIVHSVASAYFEPLNKTAEEECIGRMATLNSALTKLAPDSGAYMNENSYFEPNYQQVFWGDNYKRLFKIKKNVDPHDIFWCHPCVGNEGWEEVGDKLCRV